MSGLDNMLFVVSMIYTQWRSSGGVGEVVQLHRVLGVAKWMAEWMLGMKRSSDFLCSANIQLLKQIRGNSVLDCVLCNCVCVCVFFEVNWRNLNNYNFCSIICIYHEIYISCCWFINTKNLLSIYFHRSKMQYWGSGWMTLIVWINACWPWSFLHMPQMY